MNNDEVIQQAMKTPYPYHVKNGSVGIVVKRQVCYYPGPHYLYKLLGPSHTWFQEHELEAIILS